MRFFRNRDRAAFAIGVAVMALGAANLFVATAVTTGTPTITIPDTAQSIVIVTDVPDGVPQYGSSPDEMSSTDESYFTGNGIEFYPSYKPFRPFAVGCDLEDPNYRANPLCKNISEKEQIARLKYKEFANNPVYKCADSRNAGIDWRNMHKLSPCPTGAARLRLRWGKLRVVHTTDTLRIHRGNMSNGGNPYATEHGWDFWLSHPQASKKSGKTVYHYNVSYVWSENITLYKTFVRKNGGDWDVLANLNDRDLNPKASYDILITWTMPGRETAAWLPISDNILKNLL